MADQVDKLAEQALTAPVKTESLAVAQFSAFTSIKDFENSQRMAGMLCCSDLVPDTYRGKDKIGNCVIAMEIANRIGANIISVMQNLYIVHGRPAWSSQFLIACVNACGKFSPLRYAMTGTGDNLTCYAWAVDKTGERLEGPPVSIAMAKAEGWYTKNGSKWKTMPELMIRYRAATLFARLFSPELTMGMHTAEEIIDISPIVTEPTKTATVDAATASRLAGAGKRAETKGEADQPPASGPTDADGRPLDGKLPL